MPTAAISGGIGAIGSLFGGAMTSNAIGDAATTQANAAKYAADKQYQAADESNQFTKSVYNNTTASLGQYQDLGNYFAKQLGNLVDTNAAPNVLNSGATSVLGQFKPSSAVLQNGATSVLGQFAAPTGVTEQNDPGYQFRLQQGQQALERSAAAGGAATGGAALKAAQRYGQDYASNEYDNVYKRELGTYQQNYNDLTADSSNAYNQGLSTYQQNYNGLTNDANNTYNRLATFMNNGQNAAVQAGSAGNAAAGNVANVNANAAANAANLNTQAANAQAAGTIGQSNAWANAINGVAGNASSYLSTLKK